MNKFYKYFTTTKKGTTLMEIMLALLILAFTFLPIIGTIGTSTRDTDVANSYVYAQTTARNILDTLLDDVPFNCIKGVDGKYSIAELTDYSRTSYKIDTFKNMIGATGTKAQGTLIDERGINYEVTIYVYPIKATTLPSGGNVTGDELYFSYLPRPKYETKYDGDHKSLWYTYKANSASQYRQASSDDPYVITGKDAGVCAVATITQNACDMGAVKNYSSLCLMKKIILSITWTARDKHDRSVVLYTMKGNLDNEK